MEKAIKDAIKELAENSGMAKDSGDAMRISQAALNLAHTLATLGNMEK